MSVPYSAALADLAAETLTAAAAAPGAGTATVAVVGLGYVGLPTSLSLTDAGRSVLGIDISPARLSAIAAGEADLSAADEERLSRALASGGLRLTPDPAAIAEADAVIIAVPTPVDEHLEPDPRAVHAACATVVEHARPGQAIILTSTTYVGTTRRCLVEPLAARGLVAGREVNVAFAPERINPGESAWEQAQVPRVLGGATPACADAAAAVLAPTAKALHRVENAEAAELTKLFENTFRAVNLALVNELATICRHHDIDPLGVVDAAASKPYGFLPHYPSAGIGGHCIPVDPYYLLSPLEAAGVETPIVRQAMAEVAARPRRVADRAVELVERTGGTGGRVLVVGMAYKPGVSDHRESPASEIVRHLHDAGVTVDYHDPLVDAVTIPGAGELRSVDAPLAGDYALAVVVTVHTGHDYGWLAGVEHVLDGTYRTPLGRNRYAI